MEKGIQDKKYLKNKLKKAEEARRPKKKNIEQNRRKIVNSSYSLCNTYQPLQKDETVNLAMHTLIYMCLGILTG